MRTRFLPALAGLTLLTVAGLAVPTAAQADADCTPVIDQSSIKLTPTTVAVTSTGTKSVQAGVAFTAPCSDADGSDLYVGVGHELPDPQDNFFVEASDIIEPGNAEHSFSFEGYNDIDSRDLRNSDAGTWQTWYVVEDTNDDPDNSYVEVQGPSLRVLRAAKLSANASPEPVKKGKTITVTGKLTRANWDTRKDGAYAKQKVVLEFRTKTGSYAAVKTVTSSSTGAVSAKVAATKDGYFRFVYAGNSTTGSVKSAADLIDVR